MYFWAEDNYFLTKIFCVNWGLTITVDHGQNICRLGKILVYINVDLESRSFGHVHIVSVTVKH